MEVGKVLQPGDRGTKKLLKMYGDDLVCVRYRYDSQHRRRVTTVEIIVDEESWIHSPISGKRNQARKCDPDRVLIRVLYEEQELRSQIKQSGALWRPDDKAWEIGYKEVTVLGLEDRIVRVLE